jgi:hypothetical protein
MKIILNIVKYIGIGLFYVGGWIKTFGGNVEDFAVKRLK